MNRILVSLLASGAILVAVPGCQKSKPNNQGQAPTPKAQGETVKVDPSDKDPKAADKAESKTAESPEKSGQEAPTRERVKGPVAKVNGTEIKADEFYAELDKITARNTKIPPDRLARIEQNILKRLVEKELINQAIDKAGVKVEDAEVKAAFEEYKKRFQSDEQFQNYLRHGRVTEESIKKRLHDKRALEKLIESKGNLEVTDEEAKEFYEKNKRFYVDKAGAKARHILVKVPEKATPEQEKAAMAKIKTIQKELKDGKDFAEVAKKMSEGPSAPKGGDLGFFGKGQMVKPFEEAAFAMKPGQVSGPVRTRFGFHIIKLEEKREQRDKPFAEVKEQIQKSLRNKKFFQERRKLLQDLRKEANVETFLPEPPPAARRPTRPRVNRPPGATPRPIRKGMNPHGGRPAPKTPDKKEAPKEAPKTEGSK